MKKVILITGDIIIFYLALLLALFSRYGKNFDYDVWQTHFLPFSFLFLIWLVVFYIIGLFDFKNAANNLDFFKLLTNGFIINAFLAVAFFYLAPPQFAGITPKTNLFIYLGFFAVLMSSFRYVFNTVLSSKTAANNVIIIGSDKSALSLAKEIADKPQLGFKLKAIIETDLKNCPSLSALIKKNKINTIITALNAIRNERVMSEIWKCLPLGVKLVDIASFSDRVFARIPIDAISPIWIIEKISGRKPAYDAFKRFFDFVFALALLIITIPFWLLIAAIIKLDSKGTAFYRQKRVGQNIKNFTIIKFRTMIKDAEKAGAQWTIANDKRITVIGQFLRKTRLDELPQLINILKGEMSFVGSRAERPEFHEDFKNNIPFYEERYLVKPGLSGWAQINFRYGASVDDAKEKLQYDLYYVKNRSFILDIGIILRTLKIVLLGKGR